MVSKARDMFIISKCVVKFVDVIAFPAMVLRAKAFYEMYLLERYAAWMIGVCCSIFPPILFIMHIASTLRHIDNKIIGLRLDGGPLHFTGFCRGTSNPLSNSVG